MQLSEFFDYKNRLMYDLLTDEEIVKLINEDYSLSDSRKLVYSQVFPYEYIPETIEEGKTFICSDVEILKSQNSTFYLPAIHIWVFTHRSKLVLPEGGIRTDLLASKICERINGSHFYGMGELELYSVKRFSPMTDFNGHYMTFYTKDISRTYDPKRQIPNNRKKW